MELLTYRSFEEHVEQIIDIAQRVARALGDAGIEYRIVGGLAVYIHVEQIDPEAARMTRDVDVSVQRKDLARIADAVASHGFSLRHAAGVDMLTDTQNPENKRRVHFVFAGERVYPGDIEPIPPFSVPDTAKGFILVTPVADLVRMKLISFRLKDQVHIQDLDGVGLITPEVEAGLSPQLLARLQTVRATR